MDNDTIELEWNMYKYTSVYKHVQVYTVLIQLINSRFLMKESQSFLHSPSISEGQK